MITSKKMGVTNQNGYTLTIKEKEGSQNMTKRQKELEKILESVCGTYEDDCTRCPKQKECEEYSHICNNNESEIYRI